MLKNKDGSYNKISITILLSIIVIGLGIVISSVSSISEDILLSIFILIAIISISGIICYTFITKRKKNIVHHTITVQPVEQPVIKKEYRDVINKDSQIKLIKKSSDNFEYINLIRPLITLIVAAVTFMVGFSVINNIISAVPSIPEGSTYATQQTALNETMLTAFNIIPLMLLIGAVGFIISIMFRLANDGDNYR